MCLTSTMFCLHLFFVMPLPSSHTCCYVIVYGYHQSSSACSDCSSTVAPCVIGLPQDHSGVLQAEEFKACLISLGYDVETDKQVRAQPKKKSYGGCRLCVFAPRHSFIPSLTNSLTHLLCCCLKRCPLQVS